eukprot:m.46186 g.46186  ORF g.46186 m.46186 type:complete len:426 (-) comp6292_c0_seq1:642-1919(-)
MSSAMRAAMRMRGAALRALSSHAALRATGAPLYPGARTHFVHDFKLHSPLDTAPIPTFQILDREGNICNESAMPEVSDERMVDWYKSMVTIEQLDTFLYRLQRTGRISFYMTNFGEEAAQIGSADAFTGDDVIYGQYREVGVLLRRGMSISKLMNQCFSNAGGHGKGRQMPVHYGSAELNFHTISSPLTTQLPQAAGAAYAMRQRYPHQRAVACYFGDGAASEGDAHTAFNFASTLDCPIVYFCRNNGYAISTPVAEQYRGDGIASRAPGYGMDYMRVDGNDIFAVYSAASQARQFALEKNRPVLIELMTYRIGNHSTSDEASAYRNKEEVEKQKLHSPILRLRHLLEKRSLWNEEQEQELREANNKSIRKEAEDAAKLLKPAIYELFGDVYDKPTEHLRRQEAAMREHIAKYPGEYPVDNYVKE